MDENGISIGSIVRKAENNYIFGTTKQSRYVSHSMYDTIERIIAYLNSTHISGPVDALEREKPFFNITIAAVNVWFRATDIDRKDIRIKATKKDDTMKAVVATALLQNWMRKTNFGQFLNDWGRTLAKFGSAVVKFVEKDGVLYPSVVSWSRLIVDAVNFEANPKIEKIYYTEAELKAHPSYNQDIVKKLIACAHSVRKTTDGQQQDTLDDYIEVYEVHLVGSLQLVTNDEKDKDTYKQQMHVFSYQEVKPDEYEDFSLYSGIEAEDPYMITHLIEEDDRTLAIGAVENLFDVQWMQNHSMKAMKDTLDIASKLIFQTADVFYLGRNALNAIETGDILVHQDGKPLSQVNNSKPDITAIQNFAAQWRVLAQDITSTPDAIRGNSLPSGTPYSLGAFLGGQAGSLFEIMTENKGLSLEQMMRRKIIPHVITNELDHGDEIVAYLEENDIMQVDGMYLPYQAVKEYNNRTIEQIIKGDYANVKSFNPQAEQQGVQQGMTPFGNARSFTPDDIGKMKWSEYFKDFEWECEVEVTNEAIDKQATLTTLGTILKTAVQDPAMYKLIMSKILDQTGVVSPLEIKTAAATPPPTQTAATAATAAAPVASP